MLQQPTYYIEGSAEEPSEDWGRQVPSASFHNPPVTSKYSASADYLKIHQERDFEEQEQEEEKTDPDLMAKFESLALDESDHEDHPAELHATLIAPQPRLEPKRHASEIPHFNSEWKTGWSRPAQDRIPERLSAHSAQTVKTSVSSSLSVNSFSGHISHPPGLLPPAARGPSMYVHHPYTSYSSNNLLQPMQIPGSVQMYQMPGYYVCQPTVVPIPVPYGCFAYPQVPYKLEPRRYLSSKQQAYSGIAPVASTPTPDVSELAMALIKEYEQSGDYKKLAGQIFKLARLQGGSRFLQKELDKGDRAFVTFVLHEVSDVFPDLMIDNFGNYFCQKLLLNCAPYQRQHLLKKLKGMIYQMCLDKQGTHSVQAIIEMVLTKEEESFIASEIQGHIGELASDEHGTHVIQKGILLLHGKNQELIMKEIIADLPHTCGNANGLHVAKKLISLSTKGEYEKYQSEIVKMMMKNSIEMAQNPYGNYALQIVMDSYPIEKCAGVIESIKGKVGHLSITKYSSNVVERCMEKAGEKLRAELITELINADNFIGLMKNNFGNYVIQKALLLATPALKEELALKLQESVAFLSNKKLKANWSRVIEDLEKSGATSLTGQ